MKAYIILMNWTLSFMGLCIDMDSSPLWAVLVAVGWFIISTVLLLWADRRGVMDKVVKRFKMEEV